MEENYMLPYDYDKAMETRKWVSEIPYIKFDPSWEVKVIPPFGGATVRFLVKKNGKTVSVYLDCYDRLGCVEAPYWEAYPISEDVARFLLNDVNELVEAITKELNT